MIQPKSKSQCAASAIRPAVAKVPSSAERGDRQGGGPEAVPPDLHAAVEEDRDQRDCGDPLDVHRREAVEARPDLRGDRGDDEEERGGGDREELGDLVRPDRERERPGDEEDDQTEIGQLGHARYSRSPSELVLPVRRPAARRRARDARRTRARGHAAVPAADDGGPARGRRGGGRRRGRGLRGRRPGALSSRRPASGPRRRAHARFLLDAAREPAGAPALGLRGGGARPGAAAAGRAAPRGARPRAAAGALRRLHRAAANRPHPRGPSGHALQARPDERVGRGARAVARRARRRGRRRLQGGVHLAGGEPLRRGRPLSSDRRRHCRTR